MTVLFNLLLILIVDLPGICSGTKELSVDHICLVIARDSATLGCFLGHIGQHPRGTNLNNALDWRVMFQKDILRVDPAYVSLDIIPKRLTTVHNTIELERQIGIWLADH